MKFLADFFPILLFFIVFKLYGIYPATAVAIVASFIQVGYAWFKNHHVEKMHLITLVIIVVFGGATLLLKDEMFIKWKPTVLNWAFAIAFLGSHFIGKKTLVEHLMDHAITVEKPVWFRLNSSWILFFISMGCINLYVVYHFDTDTWVNFKLFGMLGLTITFVIMQSFYLARHVIEIPEEKKDT